MTYDAVLMDLDGTLVETQHLHDLALTRAARNEGWFWDDFRAGNYSHAISEDGGQRGRSLDRLIQYREEQGWEGAADFAIDAIREAKWTQLATLMQTMDVEGLDMTGNGRRLVEVLNEGGLPWAVVTDTPASCSLPMLRLLGANVDLITRDDANGREKPDPTIYRVARARLACEHPIAIEDDLRGAHAASAAHIPVAMVNGPKEAMRWLQEWILPGGSTTSGARPQPSRKPPA